MLETKTPQVVAASDGQRVNLGQTAEILRVNRLTVRRWLAQGRFPGARRDRVKGKPTEWFIPLAEVKAVLEEREKRRHPVDAMILDRLTREHVLRASDVTMASKRLQEANDAVWNEWNATRASGAPSAHLEALKQGYQQALELLVEAAEKYRLVATMRVNYETFASPDEDTPHPEDAGPIPT